MARCVRYLLFPGLFVATLAAYAGIVAAGISAGHAVLLVTVANFTVIAVLELIMPYRQDWQWTRDRQLINDIVHGIALSLVGGRLGEVLLTSTTALAAAYIADRSGGALWPGDAAPWFQIGLVILFADVVDWAKHRAYHHSWLWRVHALHHNPTHMHVAKAGRLHFLEATIRYALISAPLIALGAPGEVLLWYAVITNTLGNLNHSNLALPTPRWLDLLIATPAVHRLHHANDPDLGRSNLSPVTMLADHAFGSWRDPAKHSSFEVGIAEDPLPGGLVGQLASPVIWPMLVGRRLVASERETT
jgi:sterol desaturase/sphingolipid hydroxylase (fatty acid hydroxylase superfamily)